MSELVSLPVSENCSLEADYDFRHLSGQVGLVCENDPEDRYSETVYGWRSGVAVHYPDTRFYGLQEGVYLNGGEVNGVTFAAFAQEADTFNAVGASLLSHARENLNGAFVSGYNIADRNMNTVGVAVVNLANTGNLKGVNVGLVNSAGQNMWNLGLSAFNYAGGNIDGANFGVLGNWAGGDLTGFLNLSNFLNYAGGNAEGFTLAPYGVNAAGGNASGTVSSLFGNFAGGDLSGNLVTQGVNVAGGNITGAAAPTAKANLAGGSITGFFTGALVNAALEDVDGFTTASLVQFAGRDMKGANAGAFVNFAGRHMQGFENAQWFNYAGGQMVGVQTAGAAGNVAGTFGPGLHAGPVQLSDTGGVGVGVSFED